MRLINPVTRLFAGWMPGFGLLTYRGRVFAHGRGVIYCSRHFSTSMVMKSGKGRTQPYC